MLERKIDSDGIFKFISDNGHYLGYEKGQIIDNTGEKSYIYAVLEGCIIVKQSSLNGKELITKIIGPGNFFVLDISEYDSINNQYYALAKTECNLIKLNKDVFINELDKNTSLRMIWEAYVYTQVNKKNLIIRDFTLFGKKGALYSTLIRLVSTYSCKINESYKISIKLSHEELAQICGTTREFISRSMKQLQRDNIISYDNTDHCIIIRNISFLRKFIHCENCPLDICDCS
ncbi:Crp/Fnr family transcriptional regulator [Terribacillus saccharophilus]|uniref:Crp/Fnr family transcriptional regulator n=1 Tax=Terribacillus saccharophilus TaxID=361277 RepID=UPI002DC94898|nr:Crp/Fnr family transcriptional regulator [Terribacillus saccharophilus]